MTPEYQHVYQSQNDEGRQAARGVRGWPGTMMSMVNMPGDRRGND